MRSMARVLAARTSAQLEAKERLIKSALPELSRSQVSKLAHLRPLSGGKGSGRWKRIKLDDGLSQDMLRRIDEGITALEIQDISLKTRQKYVERYAMWVEFCNALNVSPVLDGKDRVTEIHLLSRYVVYEHLVQSNKHGTIRGKLAAIRYFIES